MYKHLLACLLILLLPTLVAARWINDIAVIDNPAVGAVAFSHDLHLEALGKNCVFCHNQVFNIDSNKNQPVSMAQMEQGQSCGACHNGKKAFSVAENCASCHPVGAIVFSVEEGDANFSHEVHTSMYSCSDCHPDLFVPDRSRNQRASMEEMSSGVSCGACHDGDTAFSVDENCDSCHDM